MDKWHGLKQRHLSFLSVSPDSLNWTEAFSRKKPGWETKADPLYGRTGCDSLSALPRTNNSVEPEFSSVRLGPPCAKPGAAVVATHVATAVLEHATNQAKVTGIRAQFRAVGCSVRMGLATCARCRLASWLHQRCS